MAALVPLRSDEPGAAASNPWVPCAFRAPSHPCNTGRRQPALQPPKRCLVAKTGHNSMLQRLCKAPWVINTSRVTAPWSVLLISLILLQVAQCHLWPLGWPRCLCGGRCCCSGRLAPCASTAPGSCCSFPFFCCCWGRRRRCCCCCCRPLLSLPFLSLLLLQQPRRNFRGQLCTNAGGRLRLLLLLLLLPCSGPRPCLLASSLTTSADVALLLGRLLWRILGICSTQIYHE